MPTKTTVTANVQDLAGVAATSGYVEFRLQPNSSSILYYVAGIGVIPPTPVRAAISGAGNISIDLWGNDLITPGNTWYEVILAPANEEVSRVFRLLITGGTYNLSLPAFAPSVQIVPQYQSIVTDPLEANVIPAADVVFDVGQSGRRYAKGYFKSLFVDTITGPDTSGLQFLQAGTGAVSRTVQSKLRDIVSVKDFGAVGDGVVDDHSALQAAFDTGKSVYLPEGTYRTSATLTINGDGQCFVGAGSSVCSIIADLAVTPVLQIGPSVQAFNIKLQDFRVTRATGTIPDNSVGIQWNLWNYGYEHNLMSDRHGYCWDYVGPTAPSVAIGIRSTKLHAWSAKQSYVRVKNVADLFWNHCETGTNSGDAHAPSSCLLLTGECNDVNFTDCTLVPRHANAATTTTTISWEAYTNATGDFSFINCNTENVLVAFKTDAGTALITELKIIGGRYAAPTLLSKNAATALSNMEMLGLNSGAGSFTLRDVSGRIVGSHFESTTFIGAAVDANLANLTVVGCTFAGNLIVSGDWYNLELIGNVCTGSITDTATGNVFKRSIEGEKTVTATGATIYARVANQYAFGQATPTSLLTIKQVTDTDSGGLKFVAPNSANEWALRTGSDNKLYFSYNGTAKGNIDSTTGNYTATSDERLKRDVTDLKESLPVLSQLRPVVYSMQDDPQGRRHLGFLAQEVKKVVPSAVSVMSGDVMGMDKQELIPLLVKAVQELSAQIEELKK